MLPKPSGQRPPDLPPISIALGGEDDDDQAWFRLQEALRDRTGALLGPFELMAEQHLRHGRLPGPGAVDPDWPFDSWLIRALRGGAGRRPHKLNKGAVSSSLPISLFKGLPKESRCEPSGNPLRSLAISHE